MSKGATVKIRRPDGIEVSVTPRAWRLISESGSAGRYTLLSQDAEPAEIPAKKNADHAESVETQDIGPYDVNPSDMNEDIDEIEELRNRYFERFNEEPDKRWKEKRLKKELSE